MPYITEKERKRFDTTCTELGCLCNSEGELNYILTKICLNYLDRIGRKKYAHLNTVIGVLECCKQEFYRKVVSGYENIKCDENGEVYIYEVSSTS